MHSDRNPTARTPLCLLIGQPDGQLSSRRGPDIGVSNQISPSESLFMCACLWERGRECTVPSDCWEHMCWRRPECVLKWRLMNERPECVCVWTGVKGQWTYVKESTNLSFCLPTMFACACQVILYLLSFQHLLSHSCRVQTDVGETHKASLRPHNSTSSKASTFFSGCVFVCSVCEKKREEKRRWLFACVHLEQFQLQTHWQTSPGCATSIDKQKEEICLSVFQL